MCSHGHSDFQADVKDLVQADNANTKEYSDSYKDSDNSLDDLETVLNNCYARYNRQCRFEACLTKHHE